MARSLPEPVLRAVDKPGGQSGIEVRMKVHRLATGLTLRELARRLGVSPSFLSQVENGKSQPSVATLYAIARLLNVSIDDLFDPEDGGETPAPKPRVSNLSDRSFGEPLGSESRHPERDAVPRHNSRAASSSDTQHSEEGGTRTQVTAPGSRPRLLLDSGVAWERLARSERGVDFLEVQYPPGSSSTTDQRMLRHDGFEYGYLLEGELAVTVGFDTFVLRSGDAISFDSSMPHLLTNSGSVTARGIWWGNHGYE